MKNILLIGCGAEIGALLVEMIDPAKDQMCISAIITNPIAGDPKHPDMMSIDSLYARVILAQPHLLGDVGIDREKDALIVRGRAIPVHWADIQEFDPNSMKEHFDVCILATSKRHINDAELVARLHPLADVIVGVAENLEAKAVYPCLIGAPERFLPLPPAPAPDDKVFCLGSCQSNGWQASLRAVLELAEDMKFTALDFKALEVDIVHPDTPTGRLGTKSISARQQDPRNNLRPSFSQVESSMGRLFPDSSNVNTISLRTLTMPPGYQICRFFFEYEMQGGNRLKFDDIVDSFKATASQHPSVLRVADHPLGSRGFEFAEAAAVVLPQPALMRFYDDKFGLKGSGAAPISELIVQSYVHNTRGYCRSVIEAIRYLVSDKAFKAFSV